MSSGVKDGEGVGKLSLQEDGVALAKQNGEQNSEDSIGLFGEIRKNPYKHLYEIHDVKKIVKNNIGEIIKYDLCQPLVNYYKAPKLMIFENTNTVMIASLDCPPNILEFLSKDELRRIFTDEQLFEIFNTSLQEHINMNK